MRTHNEYEVRALKSDGCVVACETFPSPGDARPFYEVIVGGAIVAAVIVRIAHGPNGERGVVLIAKRGDENAVDIHRSESEIE